MYLLLLSDIYSIMPPKKPISRTIEPFIEHDLEQKMVLLAGPRQCGKTTVARGLLSKHKGTLYNWDIERDRKIILKQSFNQESDFWIFDELHKFRRWKNWLKGVFDQYHEEKRILVTGSARLNVFKKGGDSLQGRYFFHRLYPFTVAEISGLKPANSFKEWEQFLANPLDARKGASEVVSSLLELGGFPEPFLGASQRIANRWRITYGQRLIEEDLRQLHDVREIDRIELLYDRLPEIVTSSITMKRLAFDLEVAFESVKAWIGMFENLYCCFRIPPFGLPRIQAVKKQQKMFLWDWAKIEEPGPKLENFVGLHLLRFINWAEDVWGEKLELRYFRDVQGHEVDFLIMRKREPFIAIEVKNTQQEIDRGLSYFLSKTRVPHAFQLHLKGSSENQMKTSSGAKVWQVSIGRFLSGLI